MRPLRILVLGEPRQHDLVIQLRNILEQAGPSVFALAEATQTHSIDGRDGPDCIETIKSVQPDVILVCAGKRSRERVHTVLEAAKSVKRDLPVMVFATECDAQDLCDLLEAGVQDFFTAPPKLADVLPRLWKLRLQERQEPALSPGLKERMGLKDIIGESPALLLALRRIPAVAQSDANVIITGETGTGKELCARAIHYLSPRSDKPFVPVNCGAIPLDLVENQLFGHEQGAYTGANSATPGLLRAADGGTVLLDEIDSLPLAAQVKLLRFLQERQFQPLGSSRTCSVNLRVIAACNSSLEEAIKTGRFRQDLYYRLNVVPIQLPSLRQRREDIPLLANHFLNKYGSSLAKPVTAFSSGAMQKMVAYDRPGNVRELESVVERAVILSEHSTLQGADIGLSLPAAADAGSFKFLKPGRSNSSSGPTSSNFFVRITAILHALPRPRTKTGGRPGN